MDLNLADKRALVTGSTRGIGQAAAIGLAKMGAEVIVHGKGQASLYAALENIRAAVPGAKLKGIVADLTDEDAYQHVYDEISEIDILVNNLGIYQQKEFWDISDDEWWRLFNVNVLSGIRLTRNYLPGMLERNWGRIVNVSSESGAFIPKEMIHYGVSKAAQLAFSRGTAELTAETGVTINSVLPGPTMVDTTRQQLQRKADTRGEVFDVIARETFDVRKPSGLLRRYTSADEVANMICYLCSPAASATNGAPLRVDGGIVKTYV